MTENLEQVQWFGGSLVRIGDVEQVIWLQGTAIACLKDGTSFEYVGLAAQELWTFASTCGLFLPGVNGLRMVRPHCLHLLPKEVSHV